MNPGEVATRVRDEIVKRDLHRRLERVNLLQHVRFTSNANEALIPPEAVEPLIETADDLMQGKLHVFATVHPGMGHSPDWFLDPKTGLRAAQDAPFHRVGFRDWQGSLKHVWEPSRHQHLSALVVAARATSNEGYLDLLDHQLKSWWADNLPFQGVHWVSGIEIGLRLISWVWIRRLYPDFERAAAVFEANPEFQRQLAAHQLWLSELPSLGSSANNHLVAEAAGLFSSAIFFPILNKSRAWQELAAERLEDVAASQIGADGVHAELATDYHGFVAELLTLAGLEGEIGGRPLSDHFWSQVRSMFDALAAFVDSTGHPPRQGDSDGGFGLVLDGRGFDRWGSLLRTGADLFGAAKWWPAVPGPLDARSALLKPLGPIRELAPDRPLERPGHFPEAGITVLRSEDDSGRELWCRCDAGPLGFLKTAAHGHADALSIEVRHAGVEVLVDPGTYCYQLDPTWRRYFRSTEAHNTVQIEGAPQAEPVATFMWSKPVDSSTDLYAVDPTGTSRWQGSYLADHRDGHAIRHRRTVEMGAGTLQVTDELGAPVDVTLRFHLGPSVRCELSGSVAELTWDVDDEVVRASFELPGSLDWRSVSGETDPPMGWYAPEFDEMVPTTTLEGSGHVNPGDLLVSRLRI